MKQGVIITIICFFIILVFYDGGSFDGISYSEGKPNVIDISQVEFSFHEQLYAIEQTSIVFPLLKKKVKDIVLKFSIQNNSNEHISIDARSGYITVEDAVPNGIYPLDIRISNAVSHKYHDNNNNNKIIKTTLFVLSDEKTQTTDAVIGAQNTTLPKSEQYRDLGKYIFSYNENNKQALQGTPITFDIESNKIPTDAVFYTLQSKTENAIEHTPIEPWISIDNKTGTIQIDETAQAGVYNYDILSYSTSDAFGGVSISNIAIMLTGELETAQIKYNFYKAYYGLKNHLKIISPIKHIKGLLYSIELYNIEDEISSIADEKETGISKGISKGVSINPHTGTIIIPDDLALGTYAFNIKIKNESSAVYSGSAIVPMEFAIVPTNLVHLPFEYGEDFIVQAPLKTTFGITKSRLPKHSIQYNLATPTKGILIDKHTGDISLSESVPIGSYKFSVTASSKAKEIVGVKNVFVELNVIDVFSYKTNTSLEAQKIFSISDIDNPFLFDINGLDITKDKYTASISIKNPKTNALYYQHKKPVLLNRDSAGNIGAGISASYEDWRMMKDNTTISLHIQLYKNNNPYYEYRKTMTIGNERHIYSWRDLQAMDKDLSKDYIIMNDIDFPPPGEYGFSKKGFVPLGGRSVLVTKSFSGSLNGNHKSINNLYINRKNHTAVGLFGAILIDNAKVDAKTIIKDITFNNINITGGNKTGGLFGALTLLFNAKVENKRFKIKNIHIASGIISGESIVGGIAGYIDGAFFDFVNIKNSGNVIARNKSVSYLGGLIGKIVRAYSSYKDTRTILNGYMEGNITGYSDVGGLIGHADATDVTGYMIGDVIIQSGDFGGENIGGLVGKMGTKQTSGTLKGYMSGKFRLDTSIRGTKIGGLVGQMSGGNIIGYTTSDINGGDNSLIGGLVGEAQRLSDTDSIVGYATGSYTSKNGYSGAIYARSFIRIIGYWDAESNTIIGEAGHMNNNNNKINSIDEVLYEVASDSYMVGNTEVFDDDIFLASFDLPKGGRKWPLLKDFNDGAERLFAQHIDTNQNKEERATQYKTHSYNNVDIAKYKTEEETLIDERLFIVESNEY